MLKAGLVSTSLQSTVLSKYSAFKPLVSKTSATCAPYVGVTLTPTSSPPARGRAVPPVRKNPKTVVMPYGLPALSARPHGAAEVDAALSPAGSTG